MHNFSLPTPSLFSYCLFLLHPSPGFDKSCPKSQSPDDGTHVAELNNGRKDGSDSTKNCIKYQRKNVKDKNLKAWNTRMRLVLRSMKTFVSGFIYLLYSLINNFGKCNVGKSFWDST